MTESPSQARDVEDTRQLLELSELTGVKYTEFNAKLRDEPTGLLTEFSIAVQQQRGDDFFAQRFKLAAEASDAAYVVEVATFYRLNELVEFDETIGRDFIERVAVMAAYPFLREGLAALAARLEVEVPMLGLLRAGQFKLDAPLTPDGGGKFGEIGTAADGAAMEAADSALK